MVHILLFSLSLFSYIYLFSLVYQTRYFDLHSFNKCIEFCFCGSCHFPQCFLNAWTVFIFERALAQFFVARLSSAWSTLGEGTPPTLKNPSGTGTHNMFSEGAGAVYWYCMVVAFSHHLFLPVRPVYQRFPDALAMMVCTRGICNPPQ